MSASAGLATQLIKSHLEELGYHLRFNVLTNRIENHGEPLQDGELARIHNEMRSQGISSMSHVDDVVMEVAQDNKYNPVIAYFEMLRVNESLKFDPASGDDWIHQITLYVDEAIDEGEQGVFELYLRKWMIGAVKRVLDRDGFRNPMLVLDGRQNLGKSRFAEWICPKILRNRHFRDSQLNPDNKDHILGLASTVIWEAAEFDKTANKVEADKIKSFITQRHITERLAYGRFPIDQPAITSFIGSVNNVSGFLNDASGSSRFRIVKIKSFDYIGYTNARADLVDRAWAQAVYLYDQGQTADLTPEEQEQADRINLKYSVMSNTKFALEEYFDINPDGEDFESSEYIRTILQNHGLNGKDTEARRIASALTELGCRQCAKRDSSGRLKRGWKGISKRLEAELDN